MQTTLFFIPRDEKFTHSFNTYTLQFPSLLLTPFTIFFPQHRYLHQFTPLCHPPPPPTCSNLSCSLTLFVAVCSTWSCCFNAATSLRRLCTSPGAPPPIPLGGGGALTLGAVGVPAGGGGALCPRLLLGALGGLGGLFSAHSSSSTAADCRVADCRPVLNAGVAAVAEVAAGLGGGSPFFPLPHGVCPDIILIGGGAPRPPAGGPASSSFTPTDAFLGVVLSLSFPFEKPDIESIRPPGPFPVGGAMRPPGGAVLGQTTHMRKERARWGGVARIYV